MLSFDRQKEILQFIRERHSASVTELSKKYFISETSIRRDLDKLERAGLVRKIYGGAVIMDGDNEVISLEARRQVESEAKLDIARKAASLVSNGQVIFLDSSSTALSMVPFLSGLSNLSIITNGLKTAAMLAEYTQFHVYVLGGLLNARAMSMRGTLTCQMLQGMYANRLFVSPKGIDRAGSVFCADEEEAAARRMMMTLSDETVLLCNQKKLDQHGAFHLCSLKQVHTIVCDGTPDPKWMDVFANMNVAVV